jgi:maleamate amidohydrolase
MHSNEGDGMSTEKKREAPPWMQFLTDRDRNVFAKSGYGRKGGLGARPALLIIDVNYNFTGDQPQDITDQVDDWRNACGDEGWRAVSVIQRVLAGCRAKNLPIIYTTNTRRPDGWDATSRRWKNYRALENYERETKGNAIVSEIAPQPRDIVIVKPKPSGFFGTPLLSFLIHLKVDSLLICGVSTSGCVRATVTDAFSNNFRVGAIADACFDRTEASHAINLFDMNAKYADVIESDEALAYIEPLSPDLFELPEGRLVST